MISFPNIGIEFEINNVAFTLFKNSSNPLSVHWYGIIVAVAVFLAVFYAMMRSKEFGMIADKVFDAAFIGLIASIFGARLYFVIFSSNSYTFTTFFTGIMEGGLAIYGGIIAALLAALLFMKLKKMKKLPVLDMAGICLLLGIGIGRWGNLINQEAFGSPTAGNLPWGMTGSKIAADPVVMEAEILAGTAETVLVHPCFLYESLWCLLGFALLHFYSKKLRTFDGEMFLLFAAWYGIGRFFIEALRTDSLMLGSFRISQTIAALSAGIAVGAFIAFKQNNRKNLRLYSQTEESAQEIADYELKLKLDTEKAKAKKALKKADEIAPSILGDDVGRDAPGAPESDDHPGTSCHPSEEGNDEK
jgi:phosphatidylglycerol:prolipoprotein diacylglycerol transferase